jgi:hypothetical protein
MWHQKSALIKKTFLGADEIATVDADAKPAPNYRF